MPPDVTGFLVLWRTDGYGDVHPLKPGERVRIGRAADNHIVLKDDLCSRHHAEVVPAGNGWAVQDLDSLNGSFLNNEKVRHPRPLMPGDAVRFGRAEFVYVPSLDRLPLHTRRSGDSDVDADTDPVQITRRTSRTRFLPAGAAADQTLPAVPAPLRPVATECVAVLYKLAVEMASAATPVELAEQVIEAMFHGTPAEVAAVLAIKDGVDPTVTAHRFRRGGQLTYHKVSSFVSREVLSSRQAVIAENVAADKALKDRDSLNELRAASLICAPVTAGDRVLGLLHLYSTADRSLTPDDLEFALAAAKQLGVAWDGLLGRVGLTAENRSLKAQLKLDSELVGRSAALKRVEEQVGRVAGTRATVLVRGESGVGKELVARALHFTSPRKDRPLICLNCAAITESLMESELFGHEKGSFTGATERMIGKFEAADTGSLFLDEIGELTPGAQAKLLRVLEGQAFERVGGNVPIKVDVRLIAATNRPLEAGVRDGRFRQDLYYRLQVVQIDVPPLRERVDDVPLLADHFLRRFAVETGRRVTGLSPAAVRKLVGHTWPGNVRELRNVIERAVALGAGPVLDEADVWLSPLDLTADSRGEYRAESLAEVEKRHVLATLEHTAWNKSRAAEILGVERSTLDRKIKAYDLRK